MFSHVRTVSIHAPYVSESADGTGGILTCITAGPKGSSESSSFPSLLFGSSFGSSCSLLVIESRVDLIFAATAGSKYGEFFSYRSNNLTSPGLAIPESFLQYATSTLLYNPGLDCGETPNDGVPFFPMFVPKNSNCTKSTNGWCSSPYLQSARQREFGGHGLPSHIGIGTNICHCTSCVLLSTNSSLLFFILSKYGFGMIVHAFVPIISACIISSLIFFSFLFFFFYYSSSSIDQNKRFISRSHHNTASTHPITREKKNFKLTLFQRK